MADQAAELAREIGIEFRRRMLGEYVVRIGRCVELLDEEQAWQQPGPHGNSVANLLLHLEGNVRQWILSGIHGDPDGRHRSDEFTSERTQVNTPVGELMQNLTGTVEAAVTVVCALGPEDLLRRTTFQGKFEESWIGAVLHVMEHFSGHAGQIYAHTKQTLGIDLKFYDL